MKSLAETAEPKDERLIFELDAGLRYVLEEYGSTLGALESLIPKNEITFEYLWAIFPPNTIAYGKDMLREGRAFLIRSCAEGEDPRSREVFMALQAEYIDYDGKATGKVRVELKITSFEGARRISALPYVPLALHEDAVAVRTELLDRGRKALKLHRKQLVEYQGHGLREGEKGIVKFNVSLSVLSTRYSREIYNSYSAEVVLTYSYQATWSNHARSRNVRSRSAKQ